MALTFDKYMRILLVNFNLGATEGINNGPIILSAALKRKECEIKALFLCEEMGYGFDLSRIKKDILAFNPGIIGMSPKEWLAGYPPGMNRALFYNTRISCTGVISDPASSRRPIG